MNTAEQKLNELVVAELQLYNQLLHQLSEQKAAVIKNDTDCILQINENLSVMQRQANKMAKERLELLKESELSLGSQQEVAIQQSLHQVRQQILENQEMLNLANEFVVKKIGFWVDLFNSCSENYTASGETQSATQEMQYSTVIRQV